jgi:hypothetical protein
MRQLLVLISIRGTWWCSHSMDCLLPTSPVFLLLLLLTNFSTFHSVREGIRGGYASAKQQLLTSFLTCTCGSSNPSAPNAAPPRYPHVRRRTRSASVMRRERWRRGCSLKKSCLFRRGVVHIYWEETLPPHTHHCPLAIRD